MHAVAVARELGIRTVLVPPSPGVLCAAGMLTMPIRTDMVRTLLVEAKPGSVPRVGAAVAELRADADRWLDLQGATGAGRQAEIRLDMRYRGQNYELQVLGTDPSTGDGMRQSVQEFHRIHEQAYGYAAPDRAVEIVNVRISATTAPPGADGVTPTTADRAVAPPKPAKVRPVLWTDQAGFTETPVFARSQLPVGHPLPGPAILEQFDTTVVLPPGASATPDRFGNLVIEAGAAEEGVC